MKDPLEMKRLGQGSRPQILFLQESSVHSASERIMREPQITLAGDVEELGEGEGPRGKDTISTHSFESNE